MSDLTKHTLTINISDRIEWIDKRCGLTEIQKDYITAQMKEAVSEAVQQANGVNMVEKQCNLPVVSNSLLDLDGKTIPVTFHVSKFKPKIGIDLSNDC